MIKVNYKLIKEIIEKYMVYFGENIPMVDHIIVNSKYHLDDVKAPASLIGPIDDEYGLYVNVKDYIFDTEEILVPIILHELVHYKLLLEGKQSKENQHDKAFQALAEEIEKKTNIKGIKYGKNDVHEFIRYKNRTFFPLLIENEQGKLITRVKKDKIKYWENYLKESVELNEIKKFIFLKPTNRKIFEQIPLTEGINQLSCIPYNEDMLHLKL